MGTTMSIKIKLILTCLLITATTLIIVSMMKSSTDRVKINGPLYKEIDRVKDLVADILPPPAYALEPYLVVLQALTEHDRSQLARHEARFTKLRHDYDTRSAYWATILPANTTGKLLLEKSRTPAVLFFETALREFFPALTAGNHAKAEQLLHDTLSPAYEAHRLVIDEIVLYCKAQHDSIEREAAAQLRRSNLETMVFSGLYLCVIISTFTLLMRTLTRRLRQAVAVADTIADGNVETTFPVTTDDEIGRLMTALKKMAESIRLLIDDSSMLTSAAIAGNLSVRADTSRHRGEFRKIVTGVNATLDTVIGPLQTAADCLQKLGQGEIPPQVTGEYPGEYEPIKIGANAVIDAVRMRSQDLELLSNAALQGNLALRADSSHYTGYHHTMISSINEILDRLTRPLGVAASYVELIAQGDIPPKITDSYHGDFNIIKNNLNNCIDIMNNLLSETTRVLQAAADGALDERANADLFVGEWQHLVMRVNNIVSNIVTPLRKTTELLNQEVTGRRNIQALLLNQQNQLEALNTELEERIADEVNKNREKDRTLMHNEKMVSLGHLAAGVAHEINNPMSYVTSNLKILSEYFDEIVRICRALQESGGHGPAPVTASGRKPVDIETILADGTNLIRESLDGAERVISIIQDMKSFSRMDTLQMHLVALDSCLDKALNICHNELKYVATIRKEYEPGLEVLCHPGQLNQVFLNLLVNAGQSITPPGEIILKCRHDEEFVYASVSDTGSGIPKEVVERIFDPFFTTKEMNEGTGLGLSISHEIIKNHHGEFSVESSVGSGTTFTIKLPRAPEKTA
jgi:signal transduction histidine kinase/HAMP domain-containing protein